MSVEQLCHKCKDTKKKAVAHASRTLVAAEKNMVKSKKR